MKILREELLNDLFQVKAGLSAREFIEQSSCFCFSDGYVFTFNDEVACRKATPLQISGAVQAQTLLAILEKLPDAELTVEESPQGEIIFKGEHRAFAVVRDAQIFLPINQVEVPSKWRPLPKEFMELVGLVRYCVSSDESKFMLTCVHMTPQWIEACDNVQLMRCRTEGIVGEDVLVRGSSLVHLLSLGMDRICTTRSWVHFKNPNGLILSCRRFSETYPSLDPFIDFQGHPITIPKGLSDASDRAAVFAADKAGDPLVEVGIKPGSIRIVGQGISGWYKEVKSAQYNGPSFNFVIAPELLKHLSERYSEAEITPTKLKVNGSGWVYVTVLGKPPQETGKE